jgi:hypothetical protein
MKHVFTFGLVAAALSTGCKTRLFEAADVSGRVGGNVYEVEQTTVLKLPKLPIKMASELAPEEKCTIMKGARLTLKAPPQEVEDAHLKLQIESGIPEKCDQEKFATSFIFEAHLLGNQQKRLTVPYFCQFDNIKEDIATCNNTAIAMVIAYHGTQTLGLPGRLPDQIYDKYKKANDIFKIKQTAEKIGYKTTIKQPGTIEDIKKAIDNNQPVIVGADFTGAVGHFVVITGYDENGVWVHDPAGEWDQQTVSPGNGYPWNKRCKGNFTSGKDRHYSYRAMKKAAGNLGLWLDILRK